MRSMMSGFGGDACQGRWMPVTGGEEPISGMAGRTVLSLALATGLVMLFDVAEVFAPAFADETDKTPALTARVP